MPGYQADIRPMRNTLRNTFPWLFGLIALLTMPIRSAAVPIWWNDPSLGLQVINTNSEDNYAIANLGQLKQFALGAYLYFLNRTPLPNIPGGLGEDIQSQINQWVTFDVSGVPSAKTGGASDYSKVTLGQLKATAKVYYDRMIEVGAIEAYPWTGNASDWNDFVFDDYSIVNIGQLKRVFNFDLTIELELQNNWYTINDYSSWMRVSGVGARYTSSALVFNSLVSRYASMLGISNETLLASDYDGDGISFLDEIAKGTDPFVKDLSDVPTYKSTPPVFEFFSPVGASIWNN